MDIAVNFLDLVRNSIDDEVKRKKLVRMLIDNSSQFKLAAFFNKDTGQTMTIQEIMKNEGREKAEAILEQMLISLAENIDEVKPITLTIDEVNELMEKVKNGTATSEEKEMLKVALEAGAANMDIDNNQKFIRLLILTFIDILDFANKEINFKPNLGDVSISYELFMTACLALNDKTKMARYKDASPDVITSIGKRIADDMQKACEDYWNKAGKVPAPEFIIAGLLQYLNRVCFASNFPCATGKDIQELFGFEDNNESNEEESESDNTNSGIVQPICHGSNNCSDNDSMKNLLKEDD